ncbi:PAS domain-containing sensor histidine kinase [Stutzerimonas stutzeri]|uniref:Sensor protein FixL n=1 Tax=Stutzerimonas stutzeri TaxID=316 RepID=A0A2S4AJ38_STUST|nr:PAS domain S-box protein [Stutzerimonas stutzeri]MCQ4264653.1 PAS domain S-box protein [Stutzerimonas stutzeri]POH81493.1 PAS domain-containing sensor histidine kinase [Stutzerimonas stutzeri]
MSNAGISPPHWIFVLGSLLLLLLFGGLAFNDFRARDAAWHLEIETHGELQSMALQSAQLSQRRQADMVATALAGNAELLRQMRRIDTALRDGAPLDDPRVDLLRQRLRAALTPAWRSMQRHQALQLQVFWGNAGVALLRMQQPERFGDAVAAQRPLLQRALSDGVGQFGLEVDALGASSRAIIPLRAADDPSSDVIGALEVGYNVLPELPDLSDQLAAGLALIVNRDALQAAQRTPPSGVQLGGDGHWLLIGHSATQILHWAQTGMLPEPESGLASRLLSADGRTYMLNQIPLHDERQAQPSHPLLAAALVWRDISTMQHEHHQAERRLLIKWGLAWLIAEALLLMLAFMLQRRASVRQQHQFAQQQQGRRRQRLLDRAQKIASLLPGVVFQLKRFPSGRYAFLYASEGARELYGIDPQQLLEDAPQALAHVHPDDLPRLKATLLRLAADPGTGAVEFRIQHPQRGLLWAEGRATAERLPDGTVLWHGFVTEITELMEATRALQKSESRFRAMVGNLPGVVYRCRNDGHRRMVYLSDGVERLTGYPASDFVGTGGRSFASLIHPDDLPLAQQHPQKDTFESIYRLTNAEGRTVYVREKARVLHERDDPVGWCDGFIWDVTDQALAKEEMLQRERYLSMLIDNVIDAIIIIDARGIIETFNHAAEQIFGYSAAEVIGRNLSMLMPEPDRSAHDGYLETYERRGIPRALEQNRELTALRRTGETFTIELRVSQINHHGERRFIGLVRDITERKRIERMKSELVSIVSHELRTPLTSISGALGLIVGGALGEPSPNMGQMISIAHQNSLRLGRLVDDLLDMDKLVAGKMTLDLRAHALPTQLQQAIAANQGYAAKHGVTLELLPAPDVQLMTDDDRLQQVLANLISNAVKFSPQGGTVTLGSERRDDWVRISVRDQGPGIAAEFHTRIFQKFSQADSSDSRQKEGTGLGLAISKELIEHMHGRIGFDSEPGEGACFWCELPVAPLAQDRS